MAVQFNNASINYEMIPGSVELPKHVCEAWDYLVQVDTDASIYNRREWFNLASQCQAIAPWHILVIRHDSQPIALFPLHKRTPWTWEVISWFSQGELQVLIDPAQEDVAWQGAIDWMRHNPGVFFLSLRVCRNEKRVIKLTDACRQQGVIPIITENKLPVVYSTVPESWEAFLASLSPRMRKDIRQAERELERDFSGVSVDYITDPIACHAALDQLIHLYRLRWKDESGGSVFDQIQHVEFYHHALEWAIRQGYGTIAVLSASERMIGAQILFRLPEQQTMYAPFIVRDMSISKHYSPGIVLMNHMMRWAIDQNVTTINLGAGANPYKLTFNGLVQPRWNIAMTRSQISAAIIPRLDHYLYLLQRVPIHVRHHLRRITSHSIASNSTV